MHYTVKPVLKTTGKQRPPVDKDHVLFVPLTDTKNKFTCEQRLPAFKDHFWVFPWVVFIDRLDCNDKYIFIFQNIVVLNKEKNSLHDLNIGLQPQVDSLKRNYETLKFQATARQEQDQGKIISLQLDLKKIRQVLHQIG
jgi:hypothetical protein